MSHTEIDRGTGPNNADGIPLYEAFGIINDNFGGLDTRLTVLESGNITITGDIDSTNISGENGFFGTVGMDPNTRSLTSYGSIGMAAGQIEGVKIIEGDGSINITTSGGQDSEVVNLQPGGPQSIISLNADTIEVFGKIAQDKNLEISSIPPLSSVGLPNDSAGMIAFDSNYIYYCTVDYTDGTADIWKRVAWSGDTW